MPVITVRRTTHHADKWRTYRIVVDGEVAGAVGPGEMLRKEVAPGIHTVEAKIDWCSARPLQIDVDQDIELIVESNLQGWRLALGLPTVLFRWRHYLNLRVA